MSDPVDPIDLTPGPTDAQRAALDALLADEAVWDEPPAGLEDAVVAAIAAEAARAPAGAAPGRPSAPSAARRRAPAGDEPIVLADRPARRRRGARALPFLAGAAAALLLVAVVAVAMVRTRSDEAGTVLALRAGPAAPSVARGEARLEDRPDGTRILLDVAGLPPAPPDEYYEAWLAKSPRERVSAGTFHLRGGGQGRIELWAGVPVAEYPTLNVTLEHEGAGPDAPRTLVLTGRVG